MLFSQDLLIEEVTVLPINDIRLVHMSEISTSTRTYAGAVFLLKFGLGQQSRVGLDAFLSAGKNTSISAALVPVPVPVLVLYVSTSLKSLRYMIHASGAGQWYRTEGREGGREGVERNVLTTNLVTPSP